MCYHHRTSLRFRHRFFAEHYDTHDHFYFWLHPFLCSISAKSILTATVSDPMSQHWISVFSFFGWYLCDMIDMPRFLCPLYCPHEISPAHLTESFGKAKTCCATHQQSSRRSPPSKSSLGSTKFRQDLVHTQ
eukprot:6460371-Amphidinium_carterae.1